MKKRTLTLLEIMIVIFLITLITGTIGYSMRGTLDKGRAFKTEQAREQLYDLLLMCLAENAKATVDDIARNPLNYLKNSGVAKNPNALLQDGWRHDFLIMPKGKSDFSIVSEEYDRYIARTQKDSSTTNANAKDDEDSL